MSTTETSSATRPYRTWTVQIATHGTFAAVIILLGLLVPAKESWLLSVAATVVYFLLVGFQNTGFWFGILIDQRNRISLSRAQMIAWSIVVLSGFASAALSNVANKVQNPLVVGVPVELWIVLGISTTSLVGSPLLLDMKDKKTGGQVFKKPKAEDASLGDLFKGEDASDHEYVDLPKLQMGYFTIVIVAAYAAALGSLFSNAEAGQAIKALPELDSGLLTLMGISHTGYLAVKPMEGRPAEGD